MDDYVQKNIETYKVMKSFFSPTFGSDKQNLYEKRRLDNFLNKLTSNAYILDMACGIGKITRYIFEQGFRIDGCDLCEELLNVAKENNSDIHFYFSDIRHFKMNVKYDAIILSYILFHFTTEDINSILNNAKEMLKDNGIIHIVVYVGNSQEGFIEDPINEDSLILDIVKNQRNGEKFLTYVHLMEEEEIINIIKECGYRILEKSILQTDKGIGFSENILFLDIQKL